MTECIYGYAAAINILSFLAMGLDKLCAIRGARRIRESTLLALAAAGGSIGALTGMYCFRHKTRHPQFSFGLPAILAAQLAAVFFLLRP